MIRLASTLFLILGLLVLGLPVLGCGDDEGPALAVRVVSPSGVDPIATATTGRIRVQQGEADMEVIELDLSASQLSVDFPLLSAAEPVKIRVELEGPDGALLGAPPLFFPTETAGLVAVPVVRTGMCESFAGFELEFPLDSGAVTRHGSFALILGGRREASGIAVEFLDLLELARGSFEPLTSDIGSAVATLLGPRLALVIPEAGASFIYDIRSAAVPIRMVTLHAGAGLDSRSLALSEGGAVVVGGADGVTWLDENGGAALTRLSTPRVRPAIAELDGRVLVVGGQALGESFAEIIEPGLTQGTPIAGLGTEDFRDDGLLVEAAGRFLLLGGTDRSGTPMPDSQVLEGCPACTAAAGPTWDEPRAATLLPNASGAFLVGGPGVDRVDLTASPFTIERVASFPEPLERPGAFALESGMIWVLGGTGAAGATGTIQLCAPDVLTAL